MKPFDYAFEQTLCLEGGYSDDPADRGGKTNWGITEATLNDAYLQGIVTTCYVSELKKEEARLIYKTFYWDPLKLDAVLSPAIAAEIFDTAVNMGIGTAVKIIQNSLNFLGENLTVDGSMGMKTLGAINRWIIRDERALYVCLNGFQFNRYVEITERNPTQERFARGWTKRVQTYREAGHA